MGFYIITFSFPKLNHFFFLFADAVQRKRAVPAKAMICSIKAIAINVWWLFKKIFYRMILFLKIFYYQYRAALTLSSLLLPLPPRSSNWHEQIPFDPYQKHQIEFLKKLVHLYHCMKQLFFLNLIFFKCSK